MNDNKHGKIEVFVNEEQAIARLSEINIDLLSRKILRDVALEAGDISAVDLHNNEFDKLTIEAGKLSKKAFDVNAVLSQLTFKNTKP